MENVKPIFYVYILMDPRKPGHFEYQLSNNKRITLAFEPFYVGKGSKERCHDHVRNVLAKKKEKKGFNSFKARKIAKILDTGLSVIVQKSKLCYYEEFAFQLESEIIKVIGRFDLRQGPLTNLSDGGVGNIAVSPAVVLKLRALAITQFSNQTLSQRLLWLSKKSDNGVRLSLNAPSIACPHCGFVGKSPNIYSWHFDKCPSSGYSRQPRSKGKPYKPRLSL